MKISRDEFKHLQHHWYEKLAEQGFKDIERMVGRDPEIRQPATYCLRNRDAFTIEMDAAYYYRIYQIANAEETIYRNEIDQYILVRHAEGTKINTIANELKIQGVSRERRAIRVIIRKYEMAWGIREYSRQQLQLKKIK